METQNAMRTCSVFSSFGHAERSLSYHLKKVPKIHNFINTIKYCIKQKIMFSNLNIRKTLCILYYRARVVAGNFLLFLIHDFLTNVDVVNSLKNQFTVDIV